jgi:hypothetical protein
MNRRTAFGLGGLVIVAFSLYWFSSRGREADTLSAEASRSAARAERERARRPHPSAATRERSGQRSAGLRERVGERVARRIEIVALGPNPISVTREQVLRVVATERDAFDQCVDAAGGRAVLGAALGMGAANGDSDPSATPASPAAAPTLPRPRRVVTFDVAPNGTVDPNTVATQPVLPPALAACVRGHLAASHFEGAGTDGVRVEMPFRSFLPGRGERGGRDGGVP